MRTTDDKPGDRVITWMILVLATAASLQAGASAQTGVRYSGRNFFLNGTNVPWVNFGADLGPRSAISPNNVNFSEFATIFQTIHENGGNVLRLWLHTNGAETPVFDSSGYVTGPGPYAISDLKQILSLAQQNDVGLVLCLWSFDMLQGAGTETNLTQTQVNYNYKLLTDTSYTMAYIRSSLIPMVDSVKDNPAIVAWEIFNEPEGMSSTFGGWTPTLISMSYIQRCVNLMAGAIHRTDQNALVTNGAWAFQSLTSVTPAIAAKESRLKTLESMSPAQLQTLTKEFNGIYRTNLNGQQVMDYMDKLAANTSHNYYSDSQLIAAGGDSLGTLDFYSVHYYAWMGKAYAPFLVPCSTWNLDKPVVVGEFQFSDILGSGLFSALTSQAIYPDIYSNGYAGAVNWAWNTVTGDRTETLQALSTISEDYPDNVAINIVDQALGASVTASSNDTLADPASNPDNLTDGSATTKWYASKDSSQWILIDLARPDSISRTVIDWANKTYAKAFSVQVSNDLNTWSSIYTTNNGNGGTNYVETLDSLHGTGRYLKFIFQSEGNGPYSISEIEVFGGSSSTTGVQPEAGIPTKYALEQNYPNPFNPTTAIGYQLSAVSHVTLKVYDVLGRKVVTLVYGQQDAGVYKVSFDGTKLASGVYFYTLTAGNIMITKKMLLLK
ncbi:MAG: discoidin domain-containing protein [Candidatus Kryptoniota bacterium]